MNMKYISPNKLFLKNNKFIKCNYNNFKIYKYMLRLLAIFSLNFVGDGFVTNNHNFLKSFKLKSSYDEMPSTCNDYYIDPYNEFKKKVDNLISNHDIIKRNNYTKSFSRGKSFNEIRDFLRQYSILTNVLLEVRLKKINNALSMKDVVFEKEILLNELGVILNNDKLKIDRPNLKESEMEILNKNGFLIIFSETTGAVNGLILKLKVGLSNFFIGYSLDDDKVFRLNNNIYSTTEGSIEDGIYKHEASQYEWLVDIGKYFNLNYENLGKIYYGKNNTLELCNKLYDMYSSEDEVVSIAASYIVSYWKNTDFWDDILIGFKKYNKLNDEQIPLLYWKYNKLISKKYAQINEKQLKSYYNKGRINNEKKFLSSCNVILDSLSYFWNNL